jgi:8-oxo-dGTP pyrophosphatase MutT (NUDIX family)
MIFLSEPKQFSPRFEVVSCFFEHDGEILLLKRQNHKPEGDTWGVPAGKIDEGETPEMAIVRELFQETGFEAKSDEIVHFQKIFVRFATYDFVYHIFSLKLDKRPIVKINPGEHKAFQWRTPTEALTENIIQDLDSCIKLFYEV